MCIYSFPIYLNETYKNGLQSGPLTTWYKKGQIRFKGTIHDDLISGVSFKWFENGKKKSSSTFKDGKAIGSSISTWKENGLQISGKKDKHSELGTKITKLSADDYLSECHIQNIYLKKTTVTGSIICPKHIIPAIRTKINCGKDRRSRNNSIPRMLSKKIISESPDKYLLNFSIGVNKSFCQDEWRIHLSFY